MGEVDALGRPGQIPFSPCLVGLGQALIDSKSV